MYIPKTDDELKAIAKDLWTGKIFTDRQCQDLKDIPRVFMVIPFMKKEEAVKILNNCGLIFEYLSSSTGIAINGNPTFFSFRYLNKDDTEKMFKYYDLVNQAMESI